ncbi:MAG: HAD-IA family hydrolase [Planctomycetales bacterium]|nr:HAD-IA family hydrolase [Planctomycetales bacterium]NIO45937.1 HAD-IA family hydrolase [Planctomycetales bacterium]NIP67936.1 HAD-IA family hydrolase [Planctomycetales bacterium]
MVFIQRNSDPASRIANLSQVEAILFDAVGTLIRPRRSVADTYHAVGRRHGFDVLPDVIARRFPRALRRQDQLDAQSGDWRTSEPRERQRWRDIVAEVFSNAEGAGDLDALFADLWEHFAAPENWQVYHDVQPTWRRLANQGRILGVASNLDCRLADLAAGLAPLHECQHWFISSQLGVRKPAEQFFAAIEQRLGLAAHQILLVGDDWQNDIVGARRRGWHARLLDRQRQRPGKLAIDDLADLLALLPE